MSELRHDPIHDHQVLVAPDRLRRPNAICAAPWPKNAANNCPFCKGNEAQTPQALLELTRPTDSEWMVRVVPNLYPAVRMQDVEPTGHHEVVIESPWHDVGLLDLQPEHVTLVFQAYRHRLRAMRATANLRFGLVFKNHGPAAGASLMHIHSQVVGLTKVPPAVEALWRNAGAYYQQHRRCVFCARVHDEAESGQRVIAQSNGYLAWCPYASRTAYEIWVLPRQHQGHFEQVSDGDLAELSRFVPSILARLENTIQHVAYNLAIHSAPFDSPSEDHYHWHLVITPRIAGIAGFELATGVFINPVAPEQAASELQSASAQSRPASPPSATESGSTFSSSSVVVEENL